MFELLLVVVVCLNVWADFIDRRAAIKSDAVALSLWTTIIQFLLVMPLVGLVGQLTVGQMLVCAAVGAFTALARVPWYRALSRPEGTLSRLVPFTRLSSVMVLILAFTFLGEPFSLDKLIGASLMVGGAFIISLDRSFTSFRDYLAGNKAIFLVLIFSASVAVIAVFYKYMMNAGVSIITTYFFLKFFQCLSSLLQSRRTLRRSFSAIVDVQLFVQARAIQTAAALLYLFVLRRVDLSAVEPIVAAVGPLLYLAVDKFGVWRARKYPPSGTVLPHPEIASKRGYVALLGTAAIAFGLLFVIKH